jgi:hypothetical protein
MKKTAALILVLALSLTLLGGCFRIPKNVQQAIESAAAEASNQAEDTGSGDDSNTAEETDYINGNGNSSGPEDGLVPATNLPQATAII